MPLLLGINPHLGEDRTTEGGPGRSKDGCHTPVGVKGGDEQATHNLAHVLLAPSDLPQHPG